MTPTLIFYLVLGAAASCVAQAANALPPSQPPQQAEAKRPQLSAPEISQLQAEANTGEASAQTSLGRAYRQGNGVPHNDDLAWKWFHKAADQGDAAAENDLGIMYRVGDGVAPDKEAAFHWYTKAAKHGNPQGMFNLAVCYYNGDGVGSNEYAAYAWFLLAQEAGDTAAEDAVRRSAATMSQKETADALMQIVEMYDNGEGLPKSEERALRWLRKAAEISSVAKFRLASRLLRGPDAAQKYGEAFDLCKLAAKDYAPGQNCVGYMYRHGLGVNQDSAEAVKWYQKAAAASNSAAMLTLADMYSAGDGTKVDRPAAFLLLFRATLMGVVGAKQKSRELLGQMNKPEIKQVEKNLRERQIDPKKVFADLQPVSPS